MQYDVQQPSLPELDDELQKFLEHAEARKSEYDAQTEKYRAIYAQVVNWFMDKSIEIDSRSNLENPHVVEYRRRENIKEAVERARKNQLYATHQRKIKIEQQINRINDLLQWDDDEREARQELKNGLGALYCNTKIRKSIGCLAILGIIEKKLNGIDPFADLLEPVTQHSHRKNTSTAGIYSGISRRNSPAKKLIKEMWNEWQEGVTKYSDVDLFVFDACEACKKEKAYTAKGEAPAFRTVKEDWIPEWGKEKKAKA